jgi:Tat protein secretion system quality control protein TatD with DNase activity
MPTTKHQITETQQKLLSETDWEEIETQELEDGLANSPAQQEQNLELLAEL